MSSGNLYSTDATQYKTEAEVNDGVLDVEIKKGSQKYGGYINGMEITQLEAYPEPSATSTPTVKPSATPKPTSTPTPTPIPTSKPTSTPTPTTKPTAEPTGKITVSIPQKPVLSGNSLNLSIKISNETEKAVTGDIIAAVYDEHGVLKAVLIKRKENIPKGASAQTFNFNGNLSAKTVKTMIFDSLEKMRPLFASAGETV